MTRDPAFRPCRGGKTCRSRNAWGPCSRDDPSRPGAHRVVSDPPRASTRRRRTGETGEDLAAALLHRRPALCPRRSLFQVAIAGWSDDRFRRASSPAPGEPHGSADGDDRKMLPTDSCLPHSVFKDEHPRDVRLPARRGCPRLAGDPVVHATGAPRWPVARSRPRSRGTAPGLDRSDHDHAVRRDRSPARERGPGRGWIQDTRAGSPLLMCSERDDSRRLAARCERTSRGHTREDPIPRSEGPCPGEIPGPSVTSLVRSVSSVRAAGRQPSRRSRVEEIGRAAGPDVLTLPEKT